MYTFYERDDSGITVLGKVLPGDALPADVQNVLQQTKLMDGTQFDISNKEHWKQLPAIYNGSRLWVKAEVMPATVKFVMKPQ